jgi:hypothetical protein
MIIVLAFAAWTPLLAVVGVLTGSSLIMNIAAMTGGLAIGFALVVLLANSRWVEQTITSLIIDWAGSYAASDRGPGVVPFHKHRMDDMARRASHPCQPRCSPGMGIGMTKNPEFGIGVATIASVAQTYEAPNMHG